MTDDTSERIAQIVYERGMRYLRDEAPSWVLGGNSLAQYEAREIAHQILEIAQAELQAAVAAEREACAEEVEERAAIARFKPDWCITAPICEAEALRCASRIRDRANPDPLAALAARDARVRAEALKDIKEKATEIMALEEDETEENLKGYARGSYFAAKCIRALIPADQQEEE